MNWKFFGFGKQEFKPLVSEKLGAYSLWIRIPLAILIGGLLGECLYWIYEIAIIGINNTQVIEEARAAEKAVVLIGMAFGVVASIFKGATARAKGFGFWHGMANLIIVVYAAIEILSVIKGRLSNQNLQDNARAEVINKIAALDEKIKTAKTNYDTATKHAAPPTDVAAKKKGWQAIEAERQNQTNRNRAAKAALDQKQASEELNKLRDERAAIKPPAPTETSILGADFAHWMRISGSALLILMSIVLSRFLGVIVESFGVHRSNKYVSQNTSTVEVKRYEIPAAMSPTEKYRKNVPMTPEEAAIAEALGAGRFTHDAPKAPSRPISPVAKPTQPDAPQMGDVEVPRAVKGAALATMLGMGGAQMPAFAASGDDAPVAVQAPTNLTQDAPVEPVVVGTGGGSGGDMRLVGTESTTEPLPDAKVVGVVAVQKPRISYSDFMRDESKKRELREAMRSGE